MDWIGKWIPLGVFNSKKDGLNRLFNTPKGIPFRKTKSIE